jgi:alanine racemase
VAISRLAEASGVDWLGVGTVPEGLQLREAGIGLPILKLSPTFPEEMQAAVAAGLTLSVCDPGNAAALETVSAMLGVTTQVHMELETGMARTGVTIPEAPALALFVERQCPHLHLQGAFTHLPLADGPDPTFTRAQIQRFKLAVETVQAALGRKLELVHCANSGAVLGHGDSWLNMVRPGIIIYGLYPSASAPHAIPLKRGLEFITRVTFVKRVAAGTAIGYGLTYTAPEATWIATIPVGYADGYNRLFSNRGQVLIGGRSYPVVGRVCMDLCMVDLGTETPVKVGDEVVLIGRSGELEITAEDWAEALGTINYEITCQINERGERVYLNS